MLTFNEAHHEYVYERRDQEMDGAAQDGVSAGNHPRHDDDFGGQPGLRSAPLGARILARGRQEGHGELPVVATPMPEVSPYIQQGVIWCEETARSLASTVRDLAVRPGMDQQNTWAERFDNAVKFSRVEVE